MAQCIKRLAEYFTDEGILVALIGGVRKDLALNRHNYIFLYGEIVKAILNGNQRFAVFYIAVVSVVLGGSLLASSTGSRWNCLVFTFPPETQKVVVNGTAMMEVRWRWLPEILEIMVRVNDDERGNYESNSLELLFDSDNSGNFSSRNEYPHYSTDDHGVFITAANESQISAHCYLNHYGMAWYPCSVSGYPQTAIKWPFNGSYCLYKEGEGYTFNLSIPIKFINVKPSTTIHLDYFDGDYVAWLESSGIPPEPGSTYEDEQYKALLSAEFNG